MGDGVDEKIYRVKTKDGAHINEKVKEDGSRAAIQFDEENGLQGPVDLVEVDEDEITKEVYVEVERKERSFTNILLEDVVAPVLTEVLLDLTERAVDAGVDTLFNKVIPAAKAKGTMLIDKAKSSHTEKKEKKQKTQKTQAHVSTKQGIKKKEPKEQQAVYHTQEEVNQMINNMRYAAMYIAVGIRELSGTIITDADSPEKAAEIESKLKELSSEDVMNTINFMLEDRNRDKLDQATLLLFEAFREQSIIVNGETVPISQYLDRDERKDKHLSEG